jgi:hypothetical protein
MFLNQIIQPRGTVPKNMFFRYPPGLTKAIMEIFYIIHRGITIVPGYIEYIRASINLWGSYRNIFHIHQTEEATPRSPLTSRATCALLFPTIFFDLTKLLLIQVCDNGLYYNAGKRLYEKEISNCWDPELIGMILGGGSPVTISHVFTLSSHMVGRRL